MNKIGTILKFSGIMIIFVFVADGILGSLDYDMEFSGGTLPRFGWMIVGVVSLIGVLFFFWGRALEKKNTAR